MPAELQDAKVLRGLLNSLVKPVVGTSNNTVSDFKIVIRVRQESVGVQHYRVRGNVLNCISCMKKGIQYLDPGAGRSRTLYLDPKSTGLRFEMAELLQTLGLASYEVRGGDNPEIFVRLNDSLKVKGLSEDKDYSNGVLKDLNARHEYSTKVITGFFLTPMSDEDRWDLVEEYFLGNDDYVAQRLGIAADKDHSISLQKKVKYRDDKKIFDGLLATVTNEGVAYEPQPFFRIWKQLKNACVSSQEFTDLQTLSDATKGQRFEFPCRNVELTVESTSEVLHPLLTWKASKTLLFAMNATAELDIARKTDWKAFILGQGDSIEKLADAIAIRPRSRNR